jgi:hypothetical protein
VRQNKVKKTDESAPVLIPSMTTGIIEIILLWSEHRTKARQTMTPSATMNYIKFRETGQFTGNACG